jgi:hypothetical protein
MDITLFHKVILDHGRRAREPSPNARYRPVSAIDEFAGTVGGPWESRGYIGSQSLAGAQTNT